MVDNACSIRSLVISTVDIGIVKIILLISLRGLFSENSLYFPKNPLLLNYPTFLGDNEAYDTPEKDLARGSTPAILSGFVIYGY